MKRILGKYVQLNTSVKLLLTGLFFVQLVNASFTLLINFYLDLQGYEDYQIADFTSWRFPAIMVFAVPFGIFIRGRKLKPYFMAAAVSSPAIALFIIWAAGSGLSPLIYLGFVLWGISFTLIQVTSVPYIILNSPKEQHSPAIALSFMMMSLAIFICGTSSYVLSNSFPDWFPVRDLLILFALLGFAGVYFINRIRLEEKIGEKQTNLNIGGQYDWTLIGRVIVPTIIISTGAGFTIPFVNLFFLNVHGMDGATFSLIGALSFGLVVIGTLFVPEVKDRYGYKVAIVLIQALAVLFLILMATTEYYSHLWFAPLLAITFFIIRQPLMNVAGPMTSELTLNYVGKRNQELVSALNSAIWSGSWWFSSQIFRILRESGLQYASIFFITATMYIFGILWYAYLIRDYHQRRRLGLIEEE